MNFVWQNWRDRLFLPLKKELGYQSLLKLYIGEGLRRDLVENNREHLIDKTVAVVRKHIADKKKVAAIERSLKKLTQ